MIEIGGSPIVRDPVDNLKYEADKQHFIYQIIEILPRVVWQTTNIFCLISIMIRYNYATAKHIYDRAFILIMMIYNANVGHAHHLHTFLNNDRYHGRENGNSTTS